jgi:hypothetical protein
MLTPALISIVATAYLVWKFWTGGLIGLFFKKDSPRNGADVLGEIFAFIGYLGLSVGLISVAGIVRIGANISLFFIALHSPIPQAAFCWVVIGSTMFATWYAYKHGPLTAKK